MRALRTLSTMIGLAAVVAATAAVPPIASAEPAAGAQLVAIGDSFMAAGFQRGRNHRPRRHRLQPGHR